MCSHHAWTSLFDATIFNAVIYKSHSCEYAFIWLILGLLIPLPQQLPHCLWEGKIRNTIFFFPSSPSLETQPWHLLSALNSALFSGNITFWTHSVNTSWLLCVWLGLPVCAAFLLVNRLDALVVPVVLQPYFNLLSVPINLIKLSQSNPRHSNQKLFHAPWNITETSLSEYTLIPNDKILHYPASRNVTAERGGI